MQVLFGRSGFLFDADTGGAGAGGAVVPPAAPQTPPATPPASNLPNAGGNGGPTQAELDTQFAERADRAKKAALKEVYDALGVKDETEYQAYLKAKKEAEDKNKTEAQKALDDLKKEQEESAKKDAAIADLNKRVLDSDIKQVAGQPVMDKEGKAVVRPAVRPEALTRVPALVNRALITEKDGKTVGIEEAIADLYKTDAYLFEVGQPAQKTKGTPPQLPPKNQVPPENNGSNQNTGMPKIAL